MRNGSENKTNIVSKIIIVLIIIAAIIFVYFMFFKKSTVVSSKNVKKVMTAEEITNELKEKVPHISKIVVYNEETDTNKLLGRPNQYTSKTQFADDRISQDGVENNDALGGTIEVFNNETDMQKRKDYVESISSQASMFAQYIYSKGNVLLRLEKDLTPEQAKEYETAFYDIVK